MRILSIVHLALFSVACGGSPPPPPERIEASLLVRIPCVREPCSGMAGGGDEGPPPIEGRAPITMLALGSAHSCALTEAGSIYCWGSNTRGQLGEVGFDASGTPSAVPGLPPMAAVWAGRDGTCARAADDAQLFCWGDTGLGANAGRPGFPEALPYRGVRYVALAQRRGCLLREPGELHCWGEYAPPHGPRWRAPERVRIDHPVAVSLNESRGCALRTDGRVACWGNTPAYVRIERLRGSDGLWTYADLRDVSAFRLHDGPMPLPLVQSTAGRVFQLELGPAVPETRDVAGDRSLGRRAYALDGVTDLVGWSHFCARTSAGVASCWGANARGQVGDDSDAARREEPVPLALAGVLEIAAGDNHTCARTGGEGIPAALYCWGDNEHGQLGVEGRRGHRAPTEVPW